VCTRRWPDRPGAPSTLHQHPFVDTAPAPIPRQLLPLRPPAITHPSSTLHDPPSLLGAGAPAPRFCRSLPPRWRLHRRSRRTTTAGGPRMPPPLKKAFPRSKCVRYLRSFRRGRRGCPSPRSTRGPDVQSRDHVWLPTAASPYPASTRLSLSHPKAVLSR
jgi:hypothetical protein